MARMVPPHEQMEIATPALTCASAMPGPNALVGNIVTTQAGLLDVLGTSLCTSLNQRDQFAEPKESVMIETTVPIPQTVWDCRWSHAAYRVRGAHEPLQPGSVWMWECARTGHGRSICEQDCKDCPHWEE